MKILLYSDVHWTTNSSIVRQRGERFSKRLENLISSVNWAEQLAMEKDCDAIVCLGDFFDKPTLQAEELTALMEVNWAKMPHYFIIGNHEAEGVDLRYSSIYSLPKDFIFIDEPIKFNFGRDVLMLPYGSTDDDISRSSVILSHNDLKGVRYGKVISQSGLDTKVLRDNCELCICGHLHNRCDIKGDRISIIGNLSGQNFSEDAFIYKHGAVVLNVDTLESEFVENPFAFNFYKIDMTNGEKLLLKNNAVVAVTVNESQVDDAKSKLSGCIYKLIIKKEEAQGQIEFQQVDHLQKFRECVMDKIGVNDIILNELENICK